MPARKRQPGHSYSVYVGLYADEETKQRVKRLEEDFTQPGRFATQNFYSGSSQALAERNFTRAAIMMMNNPLAFEVVMKRDGVTLIRVKAEQF